MLLLAGSRGWGSVWSLVSVVEVFVLEIGGDWKVVGSGVEVVAFDYVRLSAGF